MGVARQFWALLRLHCPRCRCGRMFRGMLAMNDPCPECGLIFRREDGYFLGAMYVSYAISTALFGGAYFLIAWLRPIWSDLGVLGAAFLVYVPFVPVVFRYSRAGWIHFERWMCPGDTSAGAFEKSRAEEVAARLKIAGPDSA